MDKRYQVFVSSTYSDLTEERRNVIQALMTIDCIPAGMELFPAANDSQFEFIKNIIDDCDYYVVIIGGRYGSLTHEGISYTEKEYDYAIEKGLPVLAFVHSNPEKISFEKSEGEPELRKKLTAFREKVQSGRLVKLWNDPRVLPNEVAMSLMHAFKRHPRVGWVRGDSIANEEVLEDAHKLQKENKRLTRRLQELTSAPRIENLADLDEKMQVHVEGLRKTGNRMIAATHVSWGQIFAAIAPELLVPQDDVSVRRNLGRLLNGAFCENPVDQYPDLNEQDFHLIKVQLSSLRLVDLTPAIAADGGPILSWQLTKEGEMLMRELLAIRSKKIPSAVESSAG